MIVQGRKYEAWIAGVEDRRREKFGKVCDIPSIYTVPVRDEQLFIRNPRGEEAMELATPHVFAAPFPFSAIEYDCSDGKFCSGFTLSTDRVLQLRFDKVTLTNAVWQ